MFLADSGDTLGERSRGEYLRQSVFGVGQGAGLGEVDGGLDGSGDFLVSLPKLLPGRYALLQEAVDEYCDRIVDWLSSISLAGRGSAGFPLDSEWERQRKVLHSRRVGPPPSLPAGLLPAPPRTQPERRYCPP